MTLTCTSRTAPAASVSTPKRNATFGMAAIGVGGWLLSGRSESCHGLLTSLLRLTRQPSPPEQAAEETGRVAEASVVQQLLHCGLGMWRGGALEGFSGGW